MAPFVTINKIKSVHAAVLRVQRSRAITRREIWADNEWKISLGADGLLLAWGVWLVFGSRGLTRIVKWARSAGQDLPPANSGNPSPSDSSRLEEK